MHDDLGACLRAWRERLSPEQAGLPAGGRRRTPGLRRQEVATLAGLSVEYLARLEQGRARNPSAAVITPLARALRLSDAERDHLLVLAGHAPRGDGVTAHLTPGLLRILDRLADTPVHVVDDTWRVVHANRLARALMGNAFFAGDANVARRQFLGPPSRVADEDGHGDRLRAQIVGQLRGALATSPQRDAVRALVDELRTASEDFARRWARGDVAVARSRHKVVVHPEVGRISLECDVLRVDDSSLRLIVYTAAPGSPDASALALLDTIGEQTFA